MKILYSGKEVANILTNHSMTLEEAMEISGYDVTSAEDLERAYDDNQEWAYIDDDGNYSWDFENLELDYDGMGSK